MGEQQIYRDAQRAGSNNSHNNNKNVCAAMVASALGVGSETRYLHNINDLKRAAMTRYSVRSVKSAAKSRTVGGARNALKEINAIAFIVWVKGHVLLIGSEGQTLVDTAPRKNDRRQIIGIWGVYPKQGVAY